MQLAHTVLNSNEEEACLTEREITETAFKHTQPVIVLRIFLGVYMLASVSTLLLHLGHH